MANISRAARASAPSVDAAGDQHWQTPTRTYRSPHGRDWLILAFFAALPIATGLDVAHELGWATQAGRLALLIAVTIGVAWAVTYFAFRIAIAVRVSETGLAVRRGPWHGAITWRDMRRLSERARAAGFAGERWIVAEAEDGRRLTIAAASLTDYEGFVADINAAFADWRAHAAELTQAAVQLDVPFLAVERAQPSAWLLLSGVGIAAFGATFYVIARAWSWPGALLAAFGLALFCLALRRGIGSRTLLLDTRGVALRGRFGASNLAWSSITGVERQRGASVPARATGRALALAQFHLLALGKWTDGKEWAPPEPIALVIKGAGRRIRLRLDRVAEPADLLAHLELHLRLAAQARAAAPPVRRVTQRLATMPRPAASQADGAAAPPAHPDLGRPTANG
ncbi:MAG TPA: hypothetical protein VGR57_12535 [Ktedonobacterales bacterium]|nr:hypothetical protein [Ktedonobacterales bacterium]